MISEKLPRDIKKQLVVRPVILSKVLFMGVADCQEYYGQNAQATPVDDSLYSVSIVLFVLMNTRSQRLI